MASLVKKKDNYYVVYRDRISGKQQWVSLRKWLGQPITNKWQANRVFRRYLALGVHKDLSALDITTFFTQYSEHGKSYKSRNTMRSEQSRIKHLLAWFRARKINNLNQITPLVVDEIRTWRSMVGGPVTTNRYLELVRAALNQAKRWGLIDENPAANTAMMKNRGLRQIRALSDDEARIIERKFPEPERTFCLFGLYAGLRKAEIMFVEWQDIDLDADTITIQSKPGFSPKSVRPATLPLHPTLKKALEKMGPVDSFIFPQLAVATWYKRITDLMKRYHIRGSIHTLRHTFCTRLVRAGVPLPMVQKLARHRSIKTTMKYSHLDQDDLKSAILKLDC